MLGLTALFVIGLAVAFYILARSRAIRVAHGDLPGLHSRPAYHGLYSLLWVGITGFIVLLVVSQGWSAYLDYSYLGKIRDALPDAPAIKHDLILSDVKAIASGALSSTTDALRESLARGFMVAERTRIVGTVVITLALAAVAGFATLRLVTVQSRARNRSERMVAALLWSSAAVAVLTTIGIVLSLIFETLAFFNNIGWRVDKFLFGTRWSPLSGVQDGVLDPDKVGAVPLFAGTLMITAIAMLVAVPIGLFAAIYLSDFASPRVRAWAKPMLEILAGIPTVVYGFFAAITVAPFIRATGEAIGFNVASESALAAGVVMGIMIIPFISSLSDDVINAVPQS